MGSQAAPYVYLTSLQAEQALALRLNDPTNIHWSIAELNLYINESLREWNCLTQAWIQDFTVTYDQPTTAPFLPEWQSTGNSLNALIGANPTSPRTQTLTDSFVYTIAQYHLLEPPTGNGTYTGTSQFTLADFTQALQRTRDDILQFTACSMSPLSLPITPTTNRIPLPDAPSQSILDIRRIRYLPAAGLGLPSTLYREDGMAFEFFNNAFNQETGTPLSWDVIAGPPLTLTLDANISIPATLDLLVMYSGGLITPPTASPLLMPDDWYWVLKFGMLADLLSKEIESTDLPRAKYCEQRFEEGMKLLGAMPWLTQARLNNVPCDTPSVAEADTFDYEWQSNPNAQPEIVRGGVDLFALSPTPSPGTSIAVTLSLIGNAPIPAADDDFIQLSRDVLDAVLDEAQHLAMFKHGGAEFAQSMALRQNFLRAAIATNSRLAESGIFESVLRPHVSRQDEAQPRFEMETKR
jgi:hypothetical protein